MSPLALCRSWPNSWPSVVRLNVTFGLMSFRLMSFGLMLQPAILYVVRFNVIRLTVVRVNVVRHTVGVLQNDSRMHFKILLYSVPVYL